MGYGPTARQFFRKCNPPMDTKLPKKPRSDAQKAAWARYLLRWRRRHDAILNRDWIKQLYVDGILPRRKTPPKSS
jgi:hypothetical protein